MKNKQVSLLTAVAIALGATAAVSPPSFSKSTAVGAYYDEKPATTKPATKTPPIVTGPVRRTKCGVVQASGSWQGDKRIIELGATKGKIRIYYDMYRIPDKMQVFYEGKELLNTGFVSYSANKMISFNGKSSALTVILTGNSNHGTLWTYTVFCPTK